MPDPAEIDRLVFQFQDRRDFRVIVPSLDHRIGNQIAEAAGEAQVFFGGDVLVAEKDHLVFQERPADFSDDAVTQRL